MALRSFARPALRSTRTILPLGGNSQVPRSFLATLAQPATHPDSANSVAIHASSISPSPASQPLLRVADFLPSELKQQHVTASTALSLQALMQANVHLGHEAAKMHKNMLPFIYGERSGIHIINLEHTLTHLRRAIAITRSIAQAGGNIVFVGTRPFLHRLTVDAALEGQAFFVTQWVGGTITNKERVLRHSVGFDPEKVIQQQYTRSSVVAEEGEGDNGDDGVEAASKKQPFVHSPDLLIILDLPNNIWAVREANRKHIPIVAICDTNCDPNLVQYPIPANDDAIASVGLVAGVLSRACQEGSALAEALNKSRLKK